MTAAGWRVLAGALAATAALTGWPAAAPAQNSHPVPYSQLVGRERSPAPKRPKPRRPIRPAVSALAPSAPSASPGPASMRSPPTPSSALRPPAPAPAPAPTPGPEGAAARATAGASFLPGTAPVAGMLAPRAAAPVAAAPVLTPDLPTAAPAGGRIVGAPGARLAPGATLPPAEVEAFIDGAVRQAGAARPLAGIAVAVVQGGAVVLEKGYGLARRAPATPVDPRATLFRLGSLSKVLTWIEVLKAVEAGRLRLDEPVNARLPPGLRLPDDGFAAPVRLRNLLAHDAGFESREFGRLFHADPAQARTMAEVLRRERPNRVRAPGDMATYSSYGAVLGAFLAAQASGRPFEDFVEADLLGPAGLTATTFREPGPARDGLPAPMPAALAQRVAQGFTWGRGGLEPQPSGVSGGWSPALGASSTADDMARLMLALLADGRAPGGGGALWGPRAEAALRTPLSPGWTHGLMRYALPGGFQGLGHDGATPAFRTKLVIVPQLDLGVFVAANSDTADRLVAALPELLVRRFYAGAAPLAPAVALPDPGAYAGAYVSTRRAYHGLEGFVGRLTRQYAVRSEADGALSIWGAEGGRRWFSSGRLGAFVAADDTGAPLTFLFDSQGRPRAFLDPAGQWGAERADALHRPEVLAGLAGLAELAALLCLVGLCVRDAREYRQSGGQTAASRVQALAAGLWLLALAGFVGFALTGAQGAGLYTAWPSLPLVAASAAALAASLLSLGALAQLPAAWAADRRVHGWSAGRKVRHTATALLFVAFAVVLLGWGALEPWSS